MKIVLNTQSSELLDDFIQISKNYSVEIINAKIEKILFDSITVGDVSAFIIENSTKYSQKAVDFIKKKQPYIPIIIIGKNPVEINNADIYVPFISNFLLYYSIIYKNIISFQKNYKILQRLTDRIKEKIEFGNCMYDPNKRTLYHNGKEIQKFSVKAGGIIETLALNYGTEKPIKKELFLEKIWQKSDWYVSRSMDVYVTNIRKVFKENNINMEIINITGRGLILR